MESLIRLTRAVAPIIASAGLSTSRWDALATESTMAATMAVQCTSKVQCPAVASRGRTLARASRISADARDKGGGS